MYGYIRPKTSNELMHFGTIGMRWGTRSGQKHIDKLVKKVDKSVRRYDAGSPWVDSKTFRKQSKKARRLTYKANRRIERMNKYINSTKGESVNNAFIKFKKDPIKVAKVKDYLARNQLQTKKLSELRTTLMDVKMDLM